MVMLLLVKLYMIALKCDVLYVINRNKYDDSVVSRNVLDDTVVNRNILLLLLLNFIYTRSEQKRSAYLGQPEYIQTYTPLSCTQ